MRRLLISTSTLVLCFLASSSMAQELRLTHREAFRRPALDVALGDGVVWIADGIGVSVATRGNPAILIGSKAFPGTTSRLAIEGDDAWIVSGTTLYRAAWDGKSIVVNGARELGEEVYDLVGARGFLYLATPSGVVQIDPAIEGSHKVLPTTNGSAVSLATDGATLLAADGDDTIEVYEIQFPVLPQKIGVAETTVAGANRVYVVNGNLLVSNGRDSQLFGSLRPPFTSLGRLELGAATAATSTPGIVFAAGQDTTIRAIDLRLSAGRPAIVFEERLPPTVGTINRISRIRSDGNFVWVAAGDLGLRIYDIVDYGTPFPIVRSFVDRADSVVDLGTGQIVAARRDGPPRLYTIETSGALREVARWQDLAGVTLLDHWDEITIAVQGGVVRLVRPSASVTGQFSFNAAVRSGVVVDDTLWVTLSDRTLWRVPLPGGPPAKVDIPGANPSWLARGQDRLVMGSLNDDGTTTVHQIDRDNPAGSSSMTIEGLATSGGAVGTEAIAVATFRGLSVLDISRGTERLSSLGEGLLPRSLEMAGGEVIVLGSDRIQRRSVADGSLIAEIRLLSPALSLAAEDDESRVIVGAAEAVYLVDVGTTASQPELLPPLRESLFVEDVVASHGVVHLMENESVHSRVLQNQTLSPEISVTTFDGDIIDVTATEDGFCGVDSLGRVECFDAGGQSRGSGQVPALDDATFLSVHSVRDAVLVSLLEGCFGSGCRKRTVLGTLASGTFQPGGEIEGEVVALDESGGRFVVVTDLPRELRLYDLPASSAVASPVATVPLSQQFFEVAIDSARNVVYLAGERVVAFSLPSLGELGDVLPPLDPSSGLTARDQGIEIAGNRAIVIGRSGALEIHRIDGPVDWVLERDIPLPAAPRRLVRDDTRFVVLTDFSLELFDTAPPIQRRRSVR